MSYMPESVTSWMGLGCKDRPGPGLGLLVGFPDLLDMSETFPPLPLQPPLSGPFQTA